MKEIKITVTDYTVETLMNGIVLLSESMGNEAFGYNINGVLTENKALSEGENAIKWIHEHYDSACAAFALIEASSRIISDGLRNGELIICAT